MSSRARVIRTHKTVRTESGRSVDYLNHMYDISDLFKTSIQKIMSGILIIMLAVMGSMIVNNNFVNAKENLSSSELNCKKCYKSILIEYGDTLWDLAAEYKGNHYESISDCIDEIMQINNLVSDKINAGQYLTVPFYDECNCYDYYNESSSESLAKTLVVLKSTTNQVKYIYT